jgi:hypothetical protein
MEDTPPANRSQEQSSDDDHIDREDIQSVLYVLAICGIIVAAASVAHLVFILMYSRFSKTQLSPSLRFPRFEVGASA